MTIGIIPGRMEASRFPGKPLADILGIPMIGHCYLRSRLARSLDDLVIATCNNEIWEYAQSIGAPCIMTSAAHPSASDRIAEAMILREKETGTQHDIVVLIQGDEPMVYPDMIDSAVDGLKQNRDAQVVNLVATIETLEDFEDPNEVKVVTDNRNRALYFSREPIPTRKKGILDVPMRKQVCIIPYRREYLIAFNETPRTPLEISEGIDMNRALETGNIVQMVPTDRTTYSVDTETDLMEVIEALRGDELRKQYSGFLGGRSS
jgi:3-deoxy-manno-octulosonate cytidylyltransferase (CMP-KDO synthetase)